MEIQRNVASWRDTTHEAIYDVFSSEDEEQHIYNTIRRLFGRKINNFRGFFCLVSKIFHGKHGKPLPQDLIPEIVSRLSAEDVLKCIMVCMGWVDVIVTPQFFVLHESRAPPVILLQNFDLTNDMKLYSLDLTYKEPYIRKFDTTKLLLHCPYRLVGTCDGLLVLHRILDSRSFRLCICNPMTGRVLAEVRVDGYHYYCGFWFHPFKREYVFLATYDQPSYGRGYCYKIFNLKGESTVLGWYDTLPSDEVPININNSLFMLQKTMGVSRNCIMIFNFETETVDFKDHPHSDHCSEGHCSYIFGNEDMQLLEVDGSLAFAHMCGNTRSLYLWILVDRTTWLWNEKYRIRLNWCYDCPIDFALHPLSVQREEMLLLCRPKRLIAFNLETRRVRDVELNIVYDKNINRAVKSTTYKGSFVGLKRMTHI